jgi:hypothetical protein
VKSLFAAVYACIELRETSVYDIFKLAMNRYVSSQLAFLLMALVASLSGCAGYVQVAITTSQAELLRNEAAQTRVRLQLLKQSVPSSAGNAAVAETLTRTIDEELRFLAFTEAKFRSLDPSNPPVEAAASVFFSDLRTNYQEAKAQLQSQIANSLVSEAFRRASLPIQQGAEQPSFSVLAHMVFRVFEQNELAYETVATADSLTFDLDVSTAPQGATISYRRRGDAYHQHPDQTNSTIHALPYAIWTVRLQKQGYRDEEREHDPFREPNHVVTVQLRQQ